ncbi:hypothetical protein JW968_00295 [Candidatus Woesearchaeota archaeon]|nr:hypothetical protein [Candidatus Woesearchaeota archaeon]
MADKPIDKTIAKMPEEQKQAIIQLAQVSLWIDTYDDIFSDFDPRPYSQRALSDDFINEAKKAVRETSRGKIELKILIPAAKRDNAQEIMIKKRLRSNFKQYLQNMHLKKRKLQNQGLFFIALGVIFMFIATFILVRNPGQGFLLTFLTVLAEPAGWFLFWEGGNLLIFKSRERDKDLEFNEKMANSSIEFNSY